MAKKIDERTATTVVSAKTDRKPNCHQPTVNAEPLPDSRGLGYQKQALAGVRHAWAIVACHRDTGEASVYTAEAVSDTSTANDPAGHLCRGCPVGRTRRLPRQSGFSGLSEIDGQNA